MMIVSQWAADGDPYRAMQYRVATPNPTGPILTDPAPPDAQPVSEWDAILAEFVGHP
ncbi:hypothetical protein ACFQZK_03300 [Rhodococcus aetherivorans]